MSDDLTVLRKHEVALVAMRNDSCCTTLRWGHAALDYALSRLREDIARAEACTVCDGRGYGKRTAQDPARDCSACKATGKRPTEVT